MFQGEFVVTKRVFLRALGLMTVASGEVNTILFITWRKWNLQHHSLADVIPFLVNVISPSNPK